MKLSNVFNTLFTRIIKVFNSDYGKPDAGRCPHCNCRQYIHKNPTLNKLSKGSHDGPVWNCVNCGKSMTSFKYVDIE